MTIDMYLAGLSQPVRELLLATRAVVRHAVPDASEYVEPDMLAYAMGANGYKNNVCVLSGHRSHVSLGFARGAFLKDPNELLEGAGRTARQVTLRSPGDVRREPLTSLLQSARRLVLERPDPWRKPARAAPPAARRSKLPAKAHRASSRR